MARLRRGVAKGMWYLGWVMGAVLRWILGLWLAFWGIVLGSLSYKSMKAADSWQRSSGAAGAAHEREGECRRDEP